MKLQQNEDCESKISEKLLNVVGVSSFEPAKLPRCSVRGTGTRTYEMSRLKYLQFIS